MRRKRALRKKMELDRLGEEDGKDVEIQLSELLAENEDLKIKVMNLQKLLGKQSQFSPRYLHSSASHVAVTTDSNKIMARKSSGEEAVPPHGTEGGGNGGEGVGGAKEAATMATDGVVLRQRMHAHRQSFRQSIIEKGDPVFADAGNRVQFEQRCSKLIGQTAQEVLPWMPVPKWSCGNAPNQWTGVCRHGDPAWTVTIVSPCLSSLPSWV